MCSTDVTPNRLAVAQEAARTFVENQPKGTRMGLVVFAGFAELVVPPTTEREELLEAIDGLTTGRGTAIGSAILKGLDAIAEINPGVQPVGDVPEPEGQYYGEPPPAPVAPPTKPTGDGFEPDIVVVLTDGREQPRDRAARRRPVRSRAAGSCLHDRLRHGEPGAARVHA